MEKVLEVSKKIWNAIHDEDLSILREYVHNEAVFVHMGVTLTRDEELEVIRERKIVYKTINFEETTVREIESTIVLLNKLTLNAIVNGNEVTNPFVVTETYTKNGDTIKLAAMSYTKITY